jgi:hypothetical protein
MWSLLDKETRNIIKEEIIRENECSYFVLESWEPYHFLFEYKKNYETMDFMNKLINESNKKDK